MCYMHIRGGPKTGQLHSTTHIFKTPEPLIDFRQRLNRRVQDEIVLKGIS